ncbi:MAG: endoglucanase, partial [Burkholderiales bacterium]|nr:endoglucanase [Burkholderiales bacterium]
ANLAETKGEASTFGFPFKAWAEKKGVSWTAWVSDHQWFPVMFKDASFNTPTAFGKLAKDWLAEKK